MNLEQVLNKANDILKDGNPERSRVKWRLGYTVKAAESLPNLRLDKIDMAFLDDRITSHVEQFREMSRQQEALFIELLKQQISDV